MPQSHRRSLRSGPTLYCALATIFVASGTTAFAAEEEYSLVDPRLKLKLIDSDPHESFLAMRTDTEGRLFVGGREALFIYEPDSNDVYGPRKELYRFPDHTWIYDIAIRGDDVYVLTLSALYVFPGLRRNPGFAQAHRLLFGVPLGHVHQCFHGLAWGPDGYLYLSMGDPLWYYGDFSRPDHWGHWTFFSFDGLNTRTPYNGVGGVFRLLPDGNQFSVVSRGLRNSCGLTFDRHFNLFTNDNDHEGMPAEYVPGRLVHVTPRSYFSWPRGWMVDKQPGRADMLETMNNDMGRAVPVGQSYYDEAFLPEEYRHNLLVARWGIRQLSRYSIDPHGASFKAKEHPVLVGHGQARPVDVTVGRGGRIFVTIAYMVHNEGSPTYRSDLVMITRADDPANAPFEPYDAPTADREKLWSELSQPSWWRRYRAHVELQRRYPHTSSSMRDEVFAKLRNAKSDDPALEHLVWLSATPGEVTATLTPFVTHPRVTVRLQAIRAIAEFDHLASKEILTKALGDTDAQVRHAALVGLFSSTGDAIPDEVVRGPARSNDSYLRQAAALLLAEKAPLDRLEKLCADSDAPTRLAGVLAAGFRLTLPGATETLPESVTLELGRPRAYSVQLANARYDLRELGRTGNYTMAHYWASSERSDENERLFGLLLRRLDDLDERVRLQAAHFLHVLNDPRSEPRVKKVRLQSNSDRLRRTRKRVVSEIWLAGPFDDADQGFDRQHPPENGAIDLATCYESGERTIGWRRQKRGRRLYEFAKIDGPSEKSSYYAYFRLNAFRAQLIHLIVGSDDGIKIWIGGELVSTNDVIRGALPYQDVVPVNLKPGSNDVLVRVHNDTGESGLYLHYAALSEVTASLPEKMGSRELEDRLRAAAVNGGEQSVGLEFLAVNWTQAVPSGNPTRGAQLYEALGCVKCHSPQGGRVGAPSLADAARRFTIPYLVQSILLPNKQVSPVFRSTLIVTTDGAALSGLVVEETAKQITLLLPDATRREIAKENVGSRELQDTSPMPNGLVKRPEELRDLLAYLVTGRSGNSLAARLGAVEATQFASTPSYSEGPTWRDGELFFCSEGLRRVARDGTVGQYLDIAPGATFLRADGRMLICDNKYKAILIMEPDGKLGVIADRYEGKPLRSLNDLTVDARGNVYWTDPVGSTVDNRTGNVFRVRPDGAVSKVAAGLAYPNGIEVDPAGEFIYLVESQTKKILRYLVPDNDSPLTNAEEFYNLGGSGGDGCAFDADGNLWVADFHRPETGSGRIVILSPAADVLGYLAIPTKVVSNLNFGGPEFDEVFCTTGTPPGVFRAKVGVRGFRGHPGYEPKVLRTLDVTPQ